MNLHLPDAVHGYFEISNGGDVSRLASCFCVDATVFDENRAHEGIEAIEAWQHEARRAFTYQVQPLQATHEGNQLIVTARLAGNFPGSPVTLNHVFGLADGRICSLEIAP